MHSSQGEIADRPYPEMLFTGDTERSLRDADCRANLSQIQRPVRIRFQEFLEPRNDRIVTSIGFYSF